MIDFTTLPNDELVYSWQDPDTKQTRMWCVGRMVEWLKTADLPIFATETTDKHADWLMEHRGLEPHRLDWLYNNPADCLLPGIVLECSDGHITLDGNHRYYILHKVGVKKFPFYKLTEEQASEFEVSNLQQLTEEQMMRLVNGFSGLGL